MTKLKGFEIIKEMKNTIKRKDLIDLYSKFNCQLWRERIESYLKINYFGNDDFNIGISKEDLNLLKEKGSKEQIAVVESYGIKLTNILPQSWEELETLKGWFINSYSNISSAECEIREDNRNIFPTKELAEAVRALAQLLQIRQVWIVGQINLNYVIRQKNNELEVVSKAPEIQRLMTFPTIKMAGDFLNAPEINKLLQIAKPLL